MNKHTGISLDQFMEEQDLEDQTINFWNIQLFLFEMDSRSISIAALIVMDSPLYVRNKYTDKILNIVYSIMADKDIPEEDTQCVATHIALQIAMIEE
jgi:hypothetical protein